MFSNGRRWCRGGITQRQPQEPRVPRLPEITPLPRVPIPLPNPGRSPFAPSCGVNPVTNTPGINPAASGVIGELRPGIGGDGRFGSRGGRHQAIDIRAPVGTSIHANRAGTVTMSQYVRGYGNVAVIEHASNAYTLSAHLRDPSGLSVGDTVGQGDVIGYAGRTGNVPRGQLATEDHLHFGFKTSPITLTRGERFNDPVGYLNSPCAPPPPPR